MRIDGFDRPVGLDTEIIGTGNHNVTGAGLHILPTANGMGDLLSRAGVGAAWPSRPSGCLISISELRRLPIPSVVRDCCNDRTAPPSEAGGICRQIEGLARQLATLDSTPDFHAVAGHLDDLVLKLYEM